jgi:hypothetical protein
MLTQIPPDSLKVWTGGRGLRCCIVERSNTPDPMNFNTQHAPWSANLSAADQAGERFRASVGTVRRLAAVPAEWADRFTPETWDDYTSERFWKYHSEACSLTPEAYLNRNA